jgi:hypothetical protein
MAKFTQIHTDVSGDPDWSDIPSGHVVEGTIERVAFLRNSTAQGRGAIALAIKLPNGRYVIAHTTYRLARTAALAIAASPAATEET